jgi:oxygen-dependent protoporphyrinogen oxidase
VVVVGGGVSGLATAYYLMRRTPALDVVVLEASGRPGGKLTNVSVGGLSLPAGPDSFLARKPWAAELCRELGVQLQAPGRGGAWLWTSRGLVPYPAGTAFGIPGDVGDVFRWPGLSGRGRRRALLDLFKGKWRGDGDQTLGSLLRRRLGNEATDLAVGPLLAGLHAGDVDRLSVRATFPELERWEESQGSLIRGAQAAMRDARGEMGPMFLRPPGGVGELPDALAARLGDAVRTGASAEALEREGSRWVVRSGSERFEADSVVLAVAAPVAAGLLESETDPSELGAIPHVSTSAVLSVYPECTADAFPEGSGFVVPRGAAPMTACTWLHQKWPQAEFGSRAVLRCFVGAAGDEDVLEAGDEQIIEACSRHLAALLPLPQEPEFASVVRWPRSMPQYELDHLERVERIRAALPPGIFVTGQSYDGVGISDCVRSAREVADQIGGTER